MDNINFSETDLKGMDLSDSTYERIEVTLPKIAGCIVSREQAIGFARVSWINSKRIYTKLKVEKREKLMLTFEQKQEIIESFPELTRKEVSMKRVNYHYEESLFDKTVVVQHLHPNGNGFVYVADIPGYELMTVDLLIFEKQLKKNFVKR